MKTRIAAILLAMLTLPIAVPAQEWRGITLLKSTCEDVKRALNVDKCDLPRSNYEIEGERVIVSFSQYPCPSDSSRQSRAWNVRPGTVIEITRFLYKSQPISDFDVSSSRWKKTFTDFLNEVIYGNAEEGIMLNTVNNKVEVITYYPSAKVQHLRCVPYPKTQSTQPCKSR